MNKPMLFFIAWLIVAALVGYSLGILHYALQYEPQPCLETEIVYV